MTTVAAASPLARTAATSPVAADLATRLWTRNLTRQHGFQPLRVDGTLPDALRGTLVRNGPALFEQFGVRYTHPFEGDGALTAVRLGDGPAAGSARLTDSAGLREELAAGRLLYGLSAPWHRRVRNFMKGRDKNTANTNVMSWQGRLFALMEGGKPTEIDPVTLATLGETDLGMVVGAFSAHPHRVAARRASYNFGLEYGRHTKLHWYELPDQGPARRLGSLQLGGPAMLHDFIATDSHLVFFVAPARVNVARLMLGLGGFDRLFEWQPRHGTEVIVIPIDRPAEVVRFTVDPFFQWHFANAYDRAGEIVVEYVRYRDFSTFHAIGGKRGGSATAFDDGNYHRAVVDPRARTLRTEVVYDHICEFPRIHPAREGGEHRMAWLALGDLGGIARLDVTTGQAVTHQLPAHQRGSEPIFVPRPGSSAEDDGWVLVLCADGKAEQSFVAIYDATRIDAGPTARIWFDQIIPITFHGAWLPA